jgi:hypothetical protein
MNDDLKTTISGVVGALAILAQWVATKFKIDLGITADLLGAITLLAGVYIAWKVAKNHKTIIPIIFLVVCLALAGFASAQTWKKGNSVSVAWDPSTAPSGVITYVLYYKPAAGGTTVLAKEVAINSGSIEIPTEGRYVLGVASKRTIGGDSVESPVSWSDNPAVTFQSQTFGLLYLNPASSPVGIRPTN